MEHKFLIIYHLEDNDGVCSCAMLKDYIEKSEFFNAKKEITLLPSTYNSLAELLTSDTFDEYFSQFTDVIMTDISFNDYKGMLKLKEKFGSHFVWIDHHAPIIKESIQHKFDDITGIRDTHRSAILLMYKYLYDEFDLKYNNGEAPLILKHLSGWDSWSWEQEGLKFEDVQYVNVAFTRESKLNVDWYGKRMSSILYSNDYNVNRVKEMYDKGEQIIHDIEETNKRMIEQVGDCTWTVDERPACCIVLYGASNSQMFKSIKDEVKNGICLKRMKNGNWGISLYNTNEGDTFHCGAYLKTKYNGGGHAGAAGATITETQFIKILKTKTI